MISSISYFTEIHFYCLASILISLHVTVNFMQKKDDSQTEVEELEDLNLDPTSRVHSHGMVILLASNCVIQLLSLISFLTSSFSRLQFRHYRCHRLHLIRRLSHHWIILYQRLSQQYYVKIRRIFRLEEYRYTTSRKCSPLMKTFS